MYRSPGRWRPGTLLGVFAALLLLVSACGGGGGGATGDGDTTQPPADTAVQPDAPPADVPPADTDRDDDGILDDGDGSGSATDAPCTGGATEGCDDNCPDDINADQADQDSDGIGDACDDDVDGDGLDAAAETAAGTDPTKADSDDDGLSDGLEVLGPDGVKSSGDEVGTDPTKADSDDDTLDDGVEDANQNGVTDAGETSPVKADSDDDGWDDAAEPACGTDALDGASVPVDTDDDGTCDAVDDDDDGDGLSDTLEGELGTDPLVEDSDEDGLSDGLEVLGPDGVAASGDEVGTDPTKADTDEDTLDDGVEDANQNGVTDAGETDPTKADSDGDGWDDPAEIACGAAPANGADTPVDTNGDGECDALDTDDDGDGLSDDEEAVLGTDPLDDDSDDDALGDGAEVVGADGVADSGDETDPMDADSDDDDLEDGVEVLGFDLTAGTDDDLCTSPVLADTDSDGLDDGLEVQGPDGVPGTEDDGCTLPCDADSDLDGWSDGDEVTCGSDPCAPADRPLDSDGDLLCDVVDPDDDDDHVADVDEAALGTDPLDVDSDDDLLDDGLELYGPDFLPDTGDEVGTDPLRADSDDDGVSDGDEDANHNGVVDAGETSPVDADSDDDGWDDGVELTCGSDPVATGDVPTDTDQDHICNVMDDDDDDDGIDDVDEATLGTDPLDKDSDDDGIEDGIEAYGTDRVAGSGDEIGLDPLDDDTDDDTLLDGEEDANHNGVVNFGETSPVDADTDDDGWDDAQEPACGNDPLDENDVPTDTDDDGVCDPLDPDDDGDDLSDVDEGTIGTDPLDTDSDDDGLDDGLEVLGPDRLPGTGDEVGTDPLAEDTDQDGLGDGEEDANHNGIVDAGETSPVDADSDDDGWEDGQEVWCNKDPLNPADMPLDTDENGVCDELQDDDDADGLTDFEELQRNLDPKDADTDDDGLGDGLEVLGPDMLLATGDEVGTDPLDDDTDDDGLLDGEEDANHNGVTDAGETNPVDADSDDDEWTDGEEVACGNGPLDAGDVPTDTDDDGICDPVDPDDDNDGLSDAEELLGADGVAGTGDETDPLDRDSDDDLLTDRQEVRGMDGAAGTGDETNPNDADTDHDGLPDGLEVLGPDGNPISGDEMGTDVLDEDTDDDGLLDGEEDANANAVLDEGETDPTQWDTDLDEWGDGEEVACGNDPVDLSDVPDDNDDDHLCDPLDPDDDNDDLSDVDEDAAGTDPFVWDSDDDGINDGLEVLGPDLAAGTGDEVGTDPLDDDSDDDGLTDGLEYLGPDGALGTGDEAGTDPLDEDTDDDRLLDGYEDANANAVVDEGETDPTVADTDADGWDDGDEDECGSDGTDGESLPLDTDGDHKCDDVQDDCVDLDADGWGDERYDASGCETGGGDCDDDNPVTYPGAAERADGVDTDCDGEDGDRIVAREFADGAACLAQLGTVDLTIDFEALAAGPVDGTAWLESGVRFLDPGAAAEGRGLAAVVGGPDCGAGVCLYDDTTGDYLDSITIDFVDECGRRYVRDGACVEWGGDNGAQDLRIAAADYHGHVLASFENSALVPGGVSGAAGLFPADADVATLAVTGPEASDLIVLKAVHFGAAKLVNDGDFIAQDGDGTCDVADNPCTPGESVGCDDNCALHDNPGQEDNDLDGIGDACDPDDDNDGVRDDADGSGVPGDYPCTAGRQVCCEDCCDDNCPFDANADQADNDGDGIGDVCDPDDDNDGVLDADGDICPFDVDPEQADWDKDNVGDGCDDTDHDGWSDRWEILCGSNANAAGSVPTDADGDGVCDGPTSQDDCLDVDQDGAGAAGNDTSGCWRTTEVDCADDDHTRHPGAVEDADGIDTDCDGDAGDGGGGPPETSVIADCEAWLGTVHDRIEFTTAPDGTPLAAGVVTGTEWSSQGVWFSDRPAGPGAPTPGLELVDEEHGCTPGALCLTDIGSTSTFRMRFQDSCNQTYVRSAMCLVFIGDEDPAHLVVTAYDRFGNELETRANADAEGGVGADTLFVVGFAGTDTDIFRVEVSGINGPTDNVPLVMVLLGEEKAIDDHDRPAADGDGSCADGDAPCDAGTTFGCDDNCPQTFNPNQLDLDCDGIGDACDPDGDGDGVPNAEEETVWGTDPFDTDSDDDGLDDALEAYGPDRIRNSGDEVGTNPALADTDDDGLDDGVEDANRNGVIDAGETSPVDDDTDNDTWIDGEEVICGSNALQAGSLPDDMDLDHVCDVMDDDTDGDGAANDIDCEADNWSRYPGAPETCDFVDNDCNGVIDDVGCHRLPFVPDGMLYDNLTPVTLSGAVAIDSDSGAIEPGIRPAGVGMRAGIWFEQVAQDGGPSLGVFSFRSLTVAQDAVVEVVGVRPPVLLSRDGISVAGEITVAGESGAAGATGVGGAAATQGGFAVAGGGSGGNGSTNAATGATSGGGARPGQAGSPGTNVGSGGGGGAFCGGGAGGSGGYAGPGQTATAPSQAGTLSTAGTGTCGSPGGCGGNGGAPYGDLLVLLQGGSGGSGGVSNTIYSPNSSAGAGGAGGGAIALITGFDVVVTATGRLDARGGEGGDAESGGGAGGSGGAIVVSGRAVTFQGQILAQGGRGGTGRLSGGFDSGGGAGGVPPLLGGGGGASVAGGGGGGSGRILVQTRVPLNLGQPGVIPGMMRPLPDTPCVVGGRSVTIDSDNDTWADWLEEWCGTDPNDNTSRPPDNDLDRICDSRDPDDDNDGLSDAEEAILHTNPWDADSDDDGLSDGLEVLGPDGVAASGDEVGTSPLDADSDDDNLDDGVEDANRNGVIDEGETDPTEADTDSDTWNDDVELACGTSPLDHGDAPNDDDDDRVCDALDPCIDADGDDAGADGTDVSRCAYTGGFDSDDGNRRRCVDSDADTCDDCASGRFDPRHDGFDTDRDGQCDRVEDQDGDGVTPNGGDCDDTDPQVFPGAREYIDGIDTDCDGAVDERQQTLEFPAAADCVALIDGPVEVVSFSELPNGTATVDGAILGDEWETQAFLLEDIADDGATGIGLTSSAGCPAGHRCFYESAGGINNPDTWRMWFIDECGVRYVRQQACIVFVDDRDPPSMVVTAWDAFGNEIATWDNAATPGGVGDGVLVTAGFLDNGAGIASFTTNGANDLQDGVPMVELHLSEALPVDDHDGVDQDGDDSCDTTDNPCATDETTGCDDNCPVTYNPDQADLDGDEMGDACDPDIDGDGVSNLDELDAGTDPANVDTDGDGLDDQLELYGPDRVPDGDVSLTDPLDDDSDDDGRLDGEEDANHNGVIDDGESAPDNDDTDDDLWLDGDEVLCGTDPTDDASVPADADDDGLCDAVQDDCVDADGDGIGAAGFATTGCVETTVTDLDDDDDSTCSDVDVDGCDDCGEFFQFAPDLDGDDADEDGLCDSGDDCVDVDGDGYGMTGFDRSGCPNGATPDCRDDDPYTYTGSTEVVDSRDNDCDGNNRELFASDELAAWAQCTALLGAGHREVQFALFPNNSPVPDGYAVVGDEWAANGVTIADVDLAGGEPSFPSPLLVTRDVAHCAGAPCLHEVVIPPNVDSMEFRFIDACGVVMTYEKVCVEFIDDDIPNEDLRIQGIDAAGNVRASFANGLDSAIGYGTNVVGVAYIASDDLDIAAIRTEAADPDDWIGFRRLAFAGGKELGDGDGVPQDGDLSCDTTDNPCTGFDVAPCDDNCPFVFNPLQSDVDADGIGDACDPDADGDGLSNVVEDAEGTDPLKADTDEDGLDDQLELYGGDRLEGTADDLPTDPLEPDSDYDGLLDGAEDVNANGMQDEGETDALDEDSDGDFFLDGEEVACGSDPLDDADVPGDADGDDECDLLDADADDDGALNEDDCEPLLDSAYPGAEEVCDGVDNNCDGYIDEYPYAGCE